MADDLLVCYRHDAPHDILQQVQPLLKALEEARFADFLSDSAVTSLSLLGDAAATDQPVEAASDDHELGVSWIKQLQSRLHVLLARDSGDQQSRCCSSTLLLLAIAAMQAFQQANVTGPPLDFYSAVLLLPASLCSTKSRLQAVRSSLVASLGVDGVGAYRLTPRVELLCLADVILDTLSSQQQQKPDWIVTWARLRKDFLRQRILSEESPSLRQAIYDSMSIVEKNLEARQDKAALVSFLQEEAAIHIHHGQDRLARTALDRATQLNGFEFALTGLLGKRTKWQQKDLSQLVVLAKSSSSGADGGQDETNGATSQVKPENLNLNDDTLLESISFAPTKAASSDDATAATEPKASATTDIKAEGLLPQSLRELDAGDQPLLLPTDSITLLLYASSITNTAPADGLTREETLPYATRVLAGGSANWQVYTQALLVRSRIEGYKSRTVERGLLQLQALVDQVIAETTPAGGESGDGDDDKGSTTTFLPRPTESESAPAQQRLRYIYPLCCPARWELEAELAARWVSLGGLRSALDIYARLEMWAEAALCWAATEREDKAVSIVRRQLFHQTAGADTKEDEADDDEGETWQGEERSPAPPDAPRLYCILGDIGGGTGMYEKAWQVSGGRYSRAQRSIGRLAFAEKNYSRAATAYQLAVKQNQLHGPSWFALGCAQLELQDFAGAAKAFTRTVQLDDSDGEAWSNLASALLHLDPSSDADNGVIDQQAAHARSVLDDEDFPPEDAASEAQVDPQRYKRDALKALKKASSLRYDKFRIWDNLLTVAASLRPPAYSDVVAAMKRIIEMRGSVEGESCVDATILDYLVRHIITISENPETGRSEYDASKPGLQRMVVKMIDEQIVPLITASARLWGTVARLALWRGRPGSALEAHEKAWRAMLSQPDWEQSTEERWDAVVEATINLVDAYESLGPMERTEGLAAGSGELVAKDWKFKARSAINSVLGKGQEMWTDSRGWETLQTSLEGLKNQS